MTPLSHVYQQIIHSQMQGHKILVVFDLDSTLFDVSSRTEQILKSFSNKSEHRIEFPDECKKISVASGQKKDWGFDEILERVGIKVQLTPFYTKLKDYWTLFFFSNEFLHADKPYPGALEFVKQLATVNVDLIYLTGRDYERMGSGTVDILKKWQFPVDSSRYKLILKPHKDIVDSYFKSYFFTQIKEQKYDAIWFFENEPVIINEVKKNHPEVNIVFVDTTHSGKATPPEDVTVIDSFMLE